MSIDLAAAVRRRIVGSSAKKAVLLHMADSASDDGSGVWTSKANIARDTELGKRTVQYAIQEMIDAGLIEEIGAKACKNGFTVEYRLILDAIEKLPSTRAPSAPVHPVHPPETRASDAPVHPVHVDPCTSRTPTRAPGAPKPSLEPSFEPSTTAQERDLPAVVAPAVAEQPNDGMTRREQVLTLMGLDTTGITPAGSFTGTTNDQAELPKWDALGLSRAEQDGVIRDMLAKQRQKSPNFVPNRWSWFTAGMNGLAEAKKSQPSLSAVASPETRRAERRKKWASF